MIKHYCDVCGIELINNGVRAGVKKDFKISFIGVNNNLHTRNFEVSSFYDLCEECLIKGFVCKNNKEV
jgi:hypothetical protein